MSMTGTIRLQAPQGKTHAKGHDAILKKLQETKANVTIIALDGKEFSGTIAGRDKYTITLLTNGIRRVFYKSAIEQFYSVE